MLNETSLNLRARVDAAVTDSLNDARTRLPSAGLLIDEIERLAGAGGKRLRPSFCYWAYRACGESDSDEIVNAAAALELLHTFAIIHDDIMDAAPQRRGQPSVHALHDVATAILAGDLALVLADHAFMYSGFPSPTMTRAFDAYSRMRQEVIEGQFMDLRASAQETISEDEARRISVMKSGRYTVEEPIAIGCALAGPETDVGAELARFARPLGEAFQHVDDLLGSFGAGSDTGKPTDTDIRQGKRHLLYALATQRLTGSDRDFFLRAWGGGDDLTDEDVERCRELLVSSGARTEVEALVTSLVRAARDALDESHVDEPGRTALRELLVQATERRT